MHAQSTSWDARPNTEPQTHQERGACPILKLGCTAQHRTSNSPGEGCMPNPQAGMHGPTPNLGEGCMPNPEVRMHGLTNSTTY